MSVSCASGTDGRYCNKGDLAEHYTGDLSILLRKAQPSGEVSGGKREIAIGGLGKQTAPSIGERTGAMWTEPREVVSMLLRCLSVIPHYPILMI